MNIAATAKTGSQRRLEKLATDLQAQALAKTYLESIRNPQPVAKEKVKKIMTIVVAKPAEVAEKIEETEAFATSAEDTVTQQQPSEPQAQEVAADTPPVSPVVANEETIAEVKPAARRKRHKKLAKPPVPTEPVAAEPTTDAVVQAEGQVAEDEQQIGVSESVAENPAATELTCDALKEATGAGTRWIWWFTHEQAKTAIGIKLSKELIENLGRFKKVPDGGWLINGTDCLPHKGPRKCNGILVSKEQKNKLEEKKVPGAFEIFKE